MSTDNKVNDFYSNIIHEFRTPLTLIISPAQQVVNESPDLVAKESAEIILRNANKLLKLINEMLDISKLENNKMILHSDEGDIVFFVRQLMESFSPYVTHKNISLLFYSDFPELHLVFDKEKLEKILNNLISNASKFTKSGGKVSVKVSLLENSILQISVTDTGIGISKDKLPFVFDRFYQGDTKRFVDQDGTGIGLSLCRELAQLMNGTIYVESLVDIGSEFILRIPIIVKTKQIKYERIIDVVHSRPNKSKDAALPYITDDITALPILLIVEDNEDMRNYLAHFFSKTYQILTAADGLEAYEQTLSVVPDIIVSDIMMPRMNGFELCEQLKNDNRTSHIPIVLLTSIGAAEKRVEGFEYGADDYLSKPFNAYELSLRFKNLIENRERLRNFYLGHPLPDVKVKHSERELKFIEKLEKFVEKNIMDENLSVEDLSEEASMSSSQLNRKLKALLNLTPNHFIRKFRLHRARTLIQNREGNISEICYKVGFSSPAYFTKCFSEEFQILPSEL